jgi:hypothetical protein
MSFFSTRNRVRSAPCQGALGHPGQGTPGPLPGTLPGCPGRGPQGYPGVALGTVHSPRVLAGRSGGTFTPFPGVPWGSPWGPVSGSPRGSPGYPWEPLPGTPNWGPGRGPWGPGNGSPRVPGTGTLGDPIPGPQDTQTWACVLKVTQLLRSRFLIKDYKINFYHFSDPTFYPPTPPYPPPGRLLRSGHPGVPPQGARQALNPYPPPGRGPGGYPCRVPPRTPSRPGVLTRQDTAAPQP